MNKKLLALIFVLSAVLPSVGQVKIDTLYYDKDGKGVENAAFATYVRVSSTPNDSNFRKLYKDFYITGELAAEGSFATIDKYDDAKSVFDGEFSKYSKEGKVLTHGYYKDGALDGTYTVYLEDGTTYTQTELKNGEPINNYYIIANDAGQSSKVSIRDNQPIYDNLRLLDRTEEFRDGVQWQIYNKNGVFISATYMQVKDYGKYHQIHFFIYNNSMFPLDVNPENITASILDDKGYDKDLKVLSVDEYIKKVNRRQNWKKFGYGFMEDLAALNAGKSTSTTVSSTDTSVHANASGSAYSSVSSTYGSASGSAFGSMSGNAYGHSTTVSTTTTYDGTAAYMAGQIADAKVAAYSNALNEDKEDKKSDYLKRSTVYPGDALSGYINVERKKGESLTVNVVINGVGHMFNWEIGE